MRTRKIQSGSRDYNLPACTYTYIPGQCLPVLHTRGAHSPLAPVSVAYVHIYQSRIIWCILTEHSEKAICKRLWKGHLRLISSCCYRVAYISRAIASFVCIHFAWPQTAADHWFLYPLYFYTIECFQII